MSNGFVFLPNHSLILSHSRDLPEELMVGVGSTPTKILLEQKDNLGCFSRTARYRRNRSITSRTQWLTHFSALRKRESVCSSACARVPRNADSHKAPSPVSVGWISTRHIYTHVVQLIIKY